MSHRDRRRRARRWIVSVSLLTLGCGADAAKPSLREIRIATGDPAGPYSVLGNALARLFSESVPAVRASAAPTSGVNANMEAVEHREADFAFATADVVYTAFTQGTASNPRPHGR